MTAPIRSLILIAGVTAVCVALVRYSGEGLVGGLVSGLIAGSLTALLAHRPARLWLRAWQWDAPRSPVRVRRRRAAEVARLLAQSSVSLTRD